MKIIRNSFRVAGHIFTADIPEIGMLPYEPFRTDNNEAEALFRLKLDFFDTDPNPGRLVRCFNDEAPYIWVFKDSPVQTGISSTDDISFGFSLSKENPGALLYVPKTEEQTECNANDCLLRISRRVQPARLEHYITNALMLLVTIFSSRKDTLMLHASAIMHDGCGYIFLGKSGTGKSTHLQLWLDNIPGCERLNDDNPLLRLTDGKPVIFGSPWSGKTPCYKNKCVPLKGIVRLHQAPFNRISQLKDFEAFAALYPSCSNIKWRRDLCDGICSTVENTIMNCPVYDLECLPDADAAFTCFNKIHKK